MEALTNSTISITPEEHLLLAPVHFVYLCLAFTLGLVVCWVTIFVCLRNQPNTLEKLFSGGLFLRILTVLFIVCCAFGLELAGRMSPATGTILAGISGYVLGGARAEKKKPKEDTGG
jgi:hypothetical protein